MPGADDPITYLLQLVLDHGVDEVLLTLNPDDADNLRDWLSVSSEVHYDLREVLMFSSRTIGS